MIKNTGIDIIEIERIKNAVSKRPRFMEKIFTEEEREYFSLRGNNICHIAGTFAAKEAVSKALGTGINRFDWNDIEIRRDKNGKPEAFLYGNAAGIAENKGIKHIHISISHSRDFAIAFAVAEGE